MKTSLPSSDLKANHVASKRAEGMLRAVNRNYGRLLKTAENDWERKFGGLDPSDICVSVRITTKRKERAAHFTFPLYR